MRCVSLKNSYLFFGLASAGTAFACLQYCSNSDAYFVCLSEHRATRTTIVDGTCYGHFASFGDAAYKRSACSAIGGESWQAYAAVRWNTALFTLLQGASD